MRQPAWEIAGTRSGLTRGKVVAAVAVSALVAATTIGEILTLSHGQRESANSTLCQEHLRQIGAGVLTYLKTGHSALPLSPTMENPHLELVTALSPTYVPAAAFYCPSQAAPDLVYTDDHFRAGQIGYFYFSATAAGADERLSKFVHDLSWPRALSAASDPTSWVASDIWLSGDPTAHSATRKGVNFLRLDGSVDFVSESPRHAFH